MLHQTRYKNYPVIRANFNTANVPLISGLDCNICLPEANITAFKKEF